MSKLEELIKRYCPNGVEYKRLGDISTISRGGSFQKKDFVENGIQCIHYGQIYTKYGISADETITCISEEAGRKAKYAEPNDIIMAVTSENVDDVCKCVAWIGKEKVAVSGHTAIIHHNQDAKYLAYYFNSIHFYKQKIKLAHGTKVIEVTPDTLNEVRIPIPHSEIQREIVRVLDYFTFLTAELTAELAARKKQYEYYCRKIFNNLKINTAMILIAELGKWSGGKTPSMAVKEFWSNGTIPWISSKDMKVPILKDTEDHVTEQAIDGASMNLHPEGSVAIVTRSGILKHTFPVAYIPFKTTVNQDIKILDARKNVSSKYVAHVLQAYSEDIRIKTKKQGGTVDSLDFQKVLTYKIPLPTMEIQNKIVNVLNNFEAICSDLNIGLPSEILARNKQYEYYRDKLLDFKELRE